MLSLALRSHSLAFRKPMPTSRGVLTERRVWFLSLTDSDRPGIVGQGECAPMPDLSVDDSPDFGASLRAFAAHFNHLALPVRDAREPLAVAGITLQPLQRDLLRTPSLLFGLETAFVDLLNGGHGLLWRSPFACDGAPLPTHGLLWMDTPEGLLQQAAAKIAAGFSVLKLKVGALPLAVETELLAELRRLYPHAALRLDANGAFAPDSALETIERLAPFAIEFLEQPIAAGQREQMRTLCERSPVPIALDEELIGVATPAARRALLDSVRPHHLILKPALLGGFGACDDWIAACRARGIQWWANSLLETPIGHNAVCQWTAARDDGRIHGLGTGALFADNLPADVRLRGSTLLRERRCASVG